MSARCWKCNNMRFFGSQRLENPLKVFSSFFYPIWIFWDILFLSSFIFGVFFYPFLIMFLSSLILVCVFVYHFFIHFLSWFYLFFIICLSSKWIKIGFSRYKRERAEEKRRILSSFLSLFYPVFIFFLSFFYRVFILFLSS